jgi:hypothetical protein
MAATVPMIAAAQTIYYRPAPGAEPVYRVDSLSVCLQRNDALWDRKGLIDQDRRLLDREEQSLARGRAELDAEYQRLDRADRVAVDSYNKRSNELNGWVDQHNQRVRELNGAAGLLNSETRELVAYCDNITPPRR